MLVDSSYIVWRRLQFVIIWIYGTIPLFAHKPKIHCLCACVCEHCVNHASVLRIWFVSDVSFFVVSQALSRYTLDTHTRTKHTMRLQNMEIWGENVFTRVILARFSWFSTEWKLWNIFTINAFDLNRDRATETPKWMLFFGIRSTWWLWTRLNS